eukprot:Pgem_evm1s2478
MDKLTLTSLDLPSLKSLDFTTSKYNIGFEVKCLSEALKFNRTLNLTSLVLSNIGIEEFKCLSEALKFNRTLRYLKLENFIGPEWMKWLGEGLKVNTNLTVRRDEMVR